MLFAYMAGKRGVHRNASRLFVAGVRTLGPTATLGVVARLTEGLKRSLAKALIKVAGLAS
jgi:hypothetical protein